MLLFITGFYVLFSLVKFLVAQILMNRLVSGTDDLAVVGKLFQTVCAPAADPGNGKYRRI